MIGHNRNYGGGKGPSIARAVAIVTSDKAAPTSAYYESLVGAEDKLRDAMAKLISAKSPGHPKSFVERANYILFAMGFWRMALPKGVMPTITQVGRFYGDCVIALNKHITCIKDGKLQDPVDLRSYVLDDGRGARELRERKARAVWKEHVKDGWPVQLEYGAPELPGLFNGLLNDGGREERNEA